MRSRIQSGTSVARLAGVALHWPALTETLGPSSSADKSPIVALLAALDAPRAKRIQINVNLKVIFEGEEEAGSTNLEWTLELHKNLLGADLLITADGSVHPTDGAFLERHRVIGGDFGGSRLVKDRSHRDGRCDESVVADRWRIRLADVAWWCTTVLNL
jgi:hypothetical protein